MLPGVGASQGLSLLPVLTWMAPRGSAANHAHVPDSVQNPCPQHAMQVTSTPPDPPPKNQHAGGSRHARGMGAPRSQTK